MQCIYLILMTKIRYLSVFTSFIIIMQLYFQCICSKKKKLPGLQDGYLNISKLIFHDEKEIFEWKNRDSLEDIRNRISMIFDNMIGSWKGSYWNDNFKLPDGYRFSL